MYIKNRFIIRNIEATSQVEDRIPAKYLGKLVERMSDENVFF